MKIEVIKDYALPCMQAEKCLKDAHQFMLANQPIKAMEAGVIAINHIQKTAPGPPAVIATATPAKLPVPTRAAKLVHNA